MEKCKHLVEGYTRTKTSLRKSIDNLKRLLGTADNCVQCDTYNTDITKTPEQPKRNPQPPPQDFHFELIEQPAPRSP